MNYVVISEGKIENTIILANENDWTPVSGKSIMPISQAVSNNIPYKDYPEKIPQSITQYQMREWLRRKGFYKTVRDWINTRTDENLKSQYLNKFQYAGIIERYDALTLVIAQMLNLNESQTDQAFLEASQIQ